MSVRPEDIQKMEQALTMMNEMIDKMEIKREGNIVIIKYYFKDENLAKMYVGGLKALFES